MNYQAIREQLISLSVELDDRTKLAEALTEKVEETRMELQRVERDCERKYGQLLEEEMEKYSQSSKEMSEKNDLAIKKKKDLIEECKALVEELKKEEEDLTTFLRNLHSKTLRDIESDRKLFKMNQEERQKKFLAAKQKEILENTERAIEPEFSRLRVANEQELSDLEIRLAAEEKRALSDLERQFEEKVQAEEKLHRENQRNLARVQLDETMREVEKMEREHKLRLEAMAEDLLREGERYKQNLNAKMKKEMETQEKNLREIETKTREKLNELRTNHEQDLLSLESDHTSKVRSLQQLFAKKKRDHESLMLRSGRRIGDLEESNGDTSLVGLRRSMDARYSEAERSQYQRLKKETNESKAKQIKAEIRKLHIETSAVEKETKERTDSELKRILDAAESEEIHLKKRQDLMLKEMAELVEEKRGLLAQLKSLTDEVCGYQTRIRETKSQTNEKQAIQSKISEKKRELQQRYEAKMRELVEGNEVIAIDLKNKMNDLTAERERSQREGEMLLLRMEEDHEERLHQINEEVRGEVAKRDEEKDLLLDAIQTEKVRQAKLKKMLQKYSRQH